MLHDTPFMLVDSLSYKLFWPMFIPFSLLLDISITKAGKSFSGVPYVFSSMVLVIFITIVHLILFSLFLFGISNLIHEKPMSLLYLMYEKLSARLYIALSIYVALAALFYLVRRRESHNRMDEKVAPKSLTVRNGKSRTVVNMDDIKWIGSDAGYLEI